MQLLTFDGLEPLGSRLDHQTRVVALAQQFLGPVGQQVRGVHRPDKSQPTAVLRVLQVPDVIVQRVAPVVERDVSAVVDVRVSHDPVESRRLEQFRHLIIFYTLRGSTS